MNELNLKPAVEFEHIGTKYCFSVMEALYIQAVKTDDFGKGYGFLSCPCFCYASIVKKIHDKYLDWTGDPMDIINSPHRQEFLKRIIEQKDYSDCYGCPKLALAPTTGFWNQADFAYCWGDVGLNIWRQYYRKQLGDGLPHTIMFNLDTACNLRCKTCRSEYIRHTYDIHADDILKLVKIAKMVTHIGVGGDGEFFASHNYDRFLAEDLTQDSKIQYITLYTNGTMLNATNWNKIHENSRKLIKEIKISLDAACEETYNNVRGPFWKQLMNGLAFIRPIAEANGIELYTTFTISKYNVQDVPKFYEFARSQGFNRVMFQFARDIFHPETGDSEDFVIPADKRKDIMDYLLDLQAKEGTFRVTIE